MRYEEDSGDILLAFVGDALATRRLNRHREPAYLQMADLLRSADATMANAETLFHEFEGTPVPDSGPYGTYVACDPAVIGDLKWLGIDVVSTANNHCVDYGETGLLVNIENLKRHGMLFAGTGRTRSEAVAPTYLDTAAGSVAFLAVTLTMPPGDHRAGEPRGVVKGRPGANVLRRRTSYTVPGPAFDSLHEIGTNLSLGRQFRAGEQSLRLMGQTYRRGPEYAMTHVLDDSDLELNLRWIRDARRLADWVVVSVHNHEGGPTRDEPAEFTSTFARLAVDAGADVVFGHGPHLDRGIEIHRGRPILYALGNFILHNDLIKHQPWDLGARLGLDGDATTADIYDTRSRAFAGGIAEDPLNFRSAIATVRFQGGELAEIQLHPLDLGGSAGRTRRGRPVLARGPLAQEVLQRFQRLSEPYGTEIDIVGDLGLVRWSGTTATGCRGTTA